MPRAGILARPPYLLAAFLCISAQLLLQGPATAGTDEMARVPAGEFLMGSPAGSDGLDDERPQRKIFLQAFWIDRYEVTNAAYRVFVEATGHRVPAHARPNISLWRGGAPPPEIHDHPVVNVSWDDAAAYCAWAGKRLPTEAEWEKAARGTEGRRYPWGDAWDHTRANGASFWAGRTVEFEDRRDWQDFWVRGEGARVARERGINGEVLTLPVGAFTNGTSPYGLHDMGGNVSEWVADWYNPFYYLLGPLSDPAGPEDGILKSVRGGSWLKPAGSFRAAYRDYGEPDGKMSGVGFRCAKDDR